MHNYSRCGGGRLLKIVTILSACALGCLLYLNYKQEQEERIRLKELQNIFVEQVQAEENELQKLELEDSFYQKLSPSPKNGHKTRGKSRIKTQR